MLEKAKNNSVNQKVWEGKMDKLLSYFFGFLGMALFAAIFILGLDFDIAIRYPDGLPSTPRSTFLFLAICGIISFILSGLTSPDEEGKNVF